MFAPLLVGALVIIIFLIGAGLMITRRLPAVITLPLMAFFIVGGTALITMLPIYDGPGISVQDILGKVLPQGIVRLHSAIIVAFLGGMLSFIMQKSGVAESLVKQGAELIGDNPLGVALFGMALVGILFTTIGGLGAFIMVSMVVLPMLATVGVPPLVASGVVLIGFSMGGILNPQNWVLYTDTLMIPVESVKLYALILFLLLAYTGIIYVVVELARAGAVRRIQQAVVVVVISGVIVAILLSGVISASAGSGATLPVFSKQFEQHWLTYDEDGNLSTRFGENDVRFTLEAPYATNLPMLSATGEQGWEELEDFSKLLPLEWKQFKNVSFIAQSDAPTTLIVTVRTSEGVFNHPHPVPADQETLITIPAEDLHKLGAGKIESLDISLAGISEDASEQTEVFLSRARFTLEKSTPSWMIVLRWIVGIAIAFVVLLACADVLARVKYWRKQVVTIKWYAYLIPILPLVLIILFEVDIMAAFVIGFIYAILATARPGSISLAVQSMIQGSAAVLPAVVLMLGIGILLISVLGPAGWSEAHNGAEWPVLAAIKPLFAYLLPRNSFWYVVGFSIAAPLALYRGPLNIWGLGFGVAGIMMATGSLLPGAIMAMLMTVGQIQGICDPTNTHNVWLANELRVDVQAIMFKMLPYVWGMVIVGLMIAGYKYF